MFKWQKAAVKVPFRKGKKKKNFQTSRRKQKIINEKKKIVKKIVLRVNSQKIKTAQNTGTVNPSLPQRLFLVSIFFSSPSPRCVFIMKTRSRSRNRHIHLCIQGAVSQTCCLKDKTGRLRTGRFAPFPAVRCPRLPSSGCFFFFFF